jgi:formylglycine-generating enzyme required for sulfatase activity
VENVRWHEALVFCNRLSIAEGLTPAYSINGNTDPAVWGTRPTNNSTPWNEAAIVPGSTGYRLPTEAQWEYAAKGGHLNENFDYAGSNTPGDVAWYVGTSNARSHEVGKKDPNGLGLYDMSGNVWEWCFDIYSNGYGSNNPQTDPVGSTGTSRNKILRGGYWYSNNNDGIGVMFRRYGQADADYDSIANPSVYGLIGFRVVRP